MSGNVVPTGDIQLLSNANSNAVAQVFGSGSTNVSLSSLVGTAYNPSVTAAPVFVAPTIPALPLTLRFFSGTSQYLTSPNSPSISELTTGGFKPTLSGGTGSYYIALGTALGGSNILNWASATTNVTTSVALTRDTKYYVSTHLSNSGNGRKSLAIMNSTPFGQPNNPTVTLTLTSPTVWSISWTEPSTSTVTTSYQWQLKQGSTVVTSATGVSAATRTINGSTELAYNTSYNAVVKGIYNGGFSEGTSTGVSLPLAPPTIQNLSSLPNRSRSKFVLNWTASASATAYNIYIGDTLIDSDVTGTSKEVDIAGYRDSVYTIRLKSKSGSFTSSYSAGIEFFLSYNYTTSQQTVTFPSSKTHTVVGIGAGGARGYDYGFGRGLGGPGGITSVQTYHARTTFYYNIGKTAGGGATTYSTHGRGGGATSVIVGSETIMIVGGGGGGSTVYRTQYAGEEPNDYRMFSGGAGGNNAGNGSDGEGGYVNTTILAYYGGPDLRVGGMTNYVGYGGGGNQSGGGAAASTVATSGYGEWQSWFGVFHTTPDDAARNPPSRVPTGGDNSIGGRSGVAHWFYYVESGSGGNGFKGGGGGGCVQMANTSYNALGSQSREEYVEPPDSAGYYETRTYYGYRFLIGGGGGGGGSSWVNGAYCNPDGTTDHGSGSDADGMLFIASRV